MTEDLQVTKRDGRVVPYEIEKIESSIEKAMTSVGMELPDDIIPLVEEKIKGMKIDTLQVEMIQDVIEDSLMELGYNSVAKAFILYRDKRRRQRELAPSLGLVDDLKLGLNAASLIKTKYLAKDKEGNPTETPSEMFRRVAKYVAQADKNYDKDADTEAVEEMFYRSMTNMEFLPNSPALFSAGKSNNTLAACFVLDIEDSMEDIFEKVKQTGIITKMGGGVGLSFSNLRPKNDMVGSTGGVSSGPVSFMRLFDTTIDVCMQGGVRRGALMGVLRCDHPDIIEFIHCKQDMKTFKNFNISVLATDEFMQAVYADKNYDLINPRTQEVVKSVSARMIFDQITYQAWNTGDPGVVFIDRINDKHPVRDLEIKGVNVCGEQPLAPYESCLLGAINLSKFVVDGKVDYTNLKRVVGIVVHFLDNMIDVNNYPLPQIAEATRKTRKIGVGIMGWHEMLIQMGIPYESKEGLELAEKVMGYIDRQAHLASKALAMVRGNFPLFDKYKKRYTAMRNAVLTTAAPTGSRSLIASTSSGIEPLFAIGHTRVTADGLQLRYVNEHFVKHAEELGIWNESLKSLISTKGVLDGYEAEGIEIPKKLRELFKTSHEISPSQHVLMQAAFQKHIGSSVSKTVNLPNSATIEDVKDIYLKAYYHGCKGVTVFRDGCRDGCGGQPLTSGCEVCEL